MTRNFVICEYSVDSGYLFPVWMIIEDFKLDWNKTFYIDINLPCEHLSYELTDIEKLAISIPKHTYVLHKTDPLKLGIHLPTLQDYVNELYGEIELVDIQQILLRICDIEEVLQYSIKLT